MTDSSWLEHIPSHIGHYLSGFADGEGSLNASLRRRDDHVLRWQVTLTFNVSQKERHILAYYKRYLGCGRLQERPDGVCYSVVANYRAINERVIPFFERFRFLSIRKQRNFAIFKKIAERMLAGDHLRIEGLRAIVKLREALNEGRGRKRKHELREFEEAFARESSETNTLDSIFDGEDRVRSHGRP